MDDETRLPLPIEQTSGQSAQGKKAGPADENEETVA
jgi:hypothetical protein